MRWKQSVCVVSSWFSCSLIDQQHGAQWAESKWELNRLHQAFVALCSLPVCGSKFSHHTVRWSPELLQIALCFTPVSWLALCLFFFSSSTICPFSLPCPVLSSVLFITKAAACRWKLFIFFRGSWRVGCPGIENPTVCLCVCTWALWAHPGQLRSAVFLCGSRLMVCRRPGVGLGTCFHKHNTTHFFFMLESLLVGIHNQLKCYPNYSNAKCNIQILGAALFLMRLNV